MAASAKDLIEELSRKPDLTVDDILVGLGRMMLDSGVTGIRPGFNLPEAVVAFAEAKKSGGANADETLKAFLAALREDPDEASVPRDNPDSGGPVASGD